MVLTVVAIRFRVSLPAPPLMESPVLKVPPAPAVVLMTPTKVSSAVVPLTTSTAAVSDQTQFPKKVIKKNLLD